jgi:CHASE2 domain-containing sensor protein
VQVLSNFAKEKKQIMTIENLIRKPEFYYWFLIPTVVAVFIFIKSILVLTKKRSVVNWLLTMLIIGLAIFSDYILGVIFFMDAWPTYLPHIGIGLALIIYGIQVYANRNTSR